MTKHTGTRCSARRTVKLQVQNNQRSHRRFPAASWRRTTAWAVLLLLAVAKSGHADPDLPIIPNRTTNVVVNFHAIGDGATDNAGSINNAITAINAAGGGTVEIPANGTLSTYLSGPITMKSSVNLQIDTNATLQMLPYGTWPSTTTFIDGATLTDVEISGPGTIDGQGTNWWVAYHSSGVSRPNFIEFDHTQRILIQNVTLQNPPTFHIYVKTSDGNLTVQNITINTPGDSPNTDGMDISSTNVLIRNCHISDGDDNLEIGGNGAPANNITVSNCWFGTGHGVSIGSDTEGGVNNLLVSNCWWNGTEYGIHGKSDTDRGGTMQNLVYEDLTMSNVNFAIAFYSTYDKVGAPQNSFTFTPSYASTYTDTGSHTPIWQNITVSNLTAIGIGGNVAGFFWGLPQAPITNFTLCQVNINAPTKTFCMYNVRGVQIINSNLTAPNTSTNTLTLYNAQFTVTNSAPNANTVTMTGLWAPSNTVLSLFNGLAETADSGAFGANPLLTLAGSTLTVSNSMSLGGSSTLNYGLGTNATKTVVTGNLTLSGTLNVANAGGFTNTTYTLFTYGGTLTYNGLTVGSVPNTNFTYTISTNTASQASLVVVGPAPPPPVASFTASPTNGAAPLSVNFTDTSSGSPTSWNWTFGDGGTSTSESPSYTYLNPGSWTASLIASNSGGASTNTEVINVYSPYAWWEQTYFGGTNNPNAAPNVDPYGTGMSNTNKFLSGFNPTNAAAYLHIISVDEQGNTNVVVTYLGASGNDTYVPGIASRTNVLDFTTGDASGNYTNGDWQDTGQTNILSGGNGSGTVTNMTDYGGATNVPSRYYRVRVLLP